MCIDIFFSDVGNGREDEADYCTQHRTVEDQWSKPEQLGDAQNSSTHTSLRTMISYQMANQSLPLLQLLTYLYPTETTLTFHT